MLGIDHRLFHYFLVLQLISHLVFILGVNLGLKFLDAVHQLSLALNILADYHFFLAQLFIDFRHGVDFVLCIFELCKYLFDVTALE